MAGRGCTITIKVLGGTSAQGASDDMSLPVALHSPLEVLKMELYAIVAIRPTDQVLILCDLTDPDRNSDRLLTGMDSLTLMECGIQTGSILTLHALGMSAEARQHMAKAALEAHPLPQPERSRSIHSGIPAESADHSYNGIVFDVESKGPCELTVFSVSVAGMLGRVRVFVRDCGWSEGPRSGRGSNHWWAHRESLSSEGWELVADQRCRPSWDRPLEIRFARPITILPHRRRALYCHSGLPDDLGIQYQSYTKDSIVAEDEFARLLPGLGHTGAQPFDDANGWYRSYRGPAGSVCYRADWMQWSPRRHLLFPSPMRDAVVTMLLCQHFGVSPPAGSGTRQLQPGPGRLNIASLPHLVVLHIMEFMNFDWFAEQAPAPVRPAPPPPRPRSRWEMLQLLQHVHGGALPEEFYLDHPHMLADDEEEFGDEDEDFEDEEGDEDNEEDDYGDEDGFDADDIDVGSEGGGGEGVGAGEDEGEGAAAPQYLHTGLEYLDGGSGSDDDSSGYDPTASLGESYRAHTANAYAEMDDDAADWGWGAQPSGSDADAMEGNDNEDGDV